MTEIMYHPASENPAEEFIELRNAAVTNVNVGGWRLTQGVSFTFPVGTVIPAGGYLVVVANTNAFAAKYPSVTNYLGDWTGVLNNSDETIQLEDALGNSREEVRYADEGDYATRVRGPLDFTHRGWDWRSDADGLGKSLERITVSLTGECGQNWASSTPTNGTPGAPNSVTSLNVAPFVRDVAHYPPVPRSSDPVTVIARLTDEQAVGSSASLFWRNASVEAPGAFASVPMFDDGAHGDGIAGDGLFGAVLAPNTNGAVIEFYISASDGQANSRTWPAPALETNGVPLQACNALFQVDDSTTDSARPSFRLVMTKAEYDELYEISSTGFAPGGYTNSLSHAAFNGTMILSENGSTVFRYNCSFRNRGAGTRRVQPPNYRVNIASDRRWNGLTALNLNSQYTHNQVVGAAIAGRAGLVTEEHRRVQLHVNGLERAAAGSPQFGSYVQQEAINSDFAANHWPGDAGGNLYRAESVLVSLTDIMGLATLSYLGPDYLEYEADGYFKNSNSSENDWSDLIQLTDLLNNTPNNNYWSAVQTVANVDQWVRYFAVFSLIGSQETSLGTGAGDDYTLYRGLVDTRFNLVGHDWDTILNQGDTPGNANASIFRATTNSETQQPLQSISRFLKHPEIAPRYYGELLIQLTNTFAPGQMAQVIDQTLSDWVPGANRTTMKTFATNRAAGVLAQIPRAITVTSSLPSLNGFPRTTSSSVTLSGRSHAARTRTVLVAGVPSIWSAWEARWTNTVSLFPGLNQVLVQALDADGLEFARTNVVIWYDDSSVANVGGGIGVNTTWTAAGGPYNVTSSIVVSNGVTLTIEPGTSLYMGAGTAITVNNGGRILAEGTAAAPIRISAAPGAGTTWNKLTVNGAVGSPETRIAYAHFENNSSTCIQVTAGTIFMDHVSFGTPTSPYLSLDGASFLVRDCHFPSTIGDFEPLHGTLGIRSDGRGIFLRNFCGSPEGYNDTFDFTGGNRPGPILQCFDNVFMGSDDDALDLDGTDAWVEGNIFLHIHRNGAPDSSSGVSGGNNGGETSQVTIVRNLFYDCDHAATAKQGNFYTMLNNTIVRQSRVGGVDTDGAVVNVSDAGATEGAGFYLEGNLIYEAEKLVRDRVNAVVTLTNNIIHQLAGSAWLGPGGNNTTNNPLLTYVPQLSETTNFTSWTAAQILWDWFKPRAGSPALGKGPNGSDIGAVNLHGVTISGEPEPVTASTSATLKVGFVRTGNGIPVSGFPNGSGYTHYQWRLDGGAWSAETPLTTDIALVGLANGPHVVEVRGKLDSGFYQDASAYAPVNLVTTSRVWTVNTGLPGLRLNEVLARNVLTLLTNNESPDLVELFNAGIATVDLSGMGLTDDPANKYKFTFAPGTTLSPGQFLVLYSEANPNPARNLGFAFGANGDSLSIFAAAANGGALLDSVSFGPQLPDYSIGRLADGDWGLCKPTFGAANQLQQATDGSTLKLNEWLASGAPTSPDDFIELFNPDPVPAAMGGLFLSDAPDGYPARHQIAPLSFIAPAGWFAFKADGNTDSGPEHLNFQLASEQGRIGLFGPALTLIDYIAYGPQNSGVSEGRTPDGADAFADFGTPTPGAGNPGALPAYVTNLNVQLMAFTNVWRFNQSNNLDGVNWTAPAYNDANWQSGPGLLAGGESNPAIVPLVNTTLRAPNSPPPGLGAGHAYYFRTKLVVTNDLAEFTVTARMRLDDCGVIYVNGVEFSRPRMPAGTITNLSFGGAAVGNESEADIDEVINIPSALLPVGTNTIAMEVHQTGTGSSDMVWGLALEANKYFTNLTTIVLNEVLADNGSYSNADGTITDWVEIFNPSGVQVNLSGYSLSDNPTAPGQWVFPSGTIVAPGGFLVVRCDPNSPATTTFGPILNTGFGLDSSGDAVCLFTPGFALFDSVVFGPQAADFSLGHAPAGSLTWSLTLPTPGAANIAATLGDVTGIRINEWAAAVASGPDWFELYNSNPQPVALAGLYLTDALQDREKHPIAALSFMGVNTNGWTKFIADNEPEQGPHHVGFSLNGTQGESIGLFPAGVAPAIDQVTFGQQTTGISEGRLPDGTANRVFFTFPSPGTANWLPLTNVVINEVLTHTDLPLEDAIELRNLSAVPVDISGWFISDALTDLRKFRIPDGTVLPAFGYRVFYEQQFNPQPGHVKSFSFSSSQGDDAWLTAADLVGNPTGFRDHAEFGPAFNGVSFGRYPTTVGVDFPAVSTLTFGTAVTAQSPTNQIGLFRTGAGAANVYPAIGPVVITEIMYHPTPVGTNENPNEEFIELHNLSGFTVPLYNPAHPTNGWRLRDAVSFQFNSSHSVPAGGYLLLVGFDPATNAAALSAFRSKYGTNGTVLGPWSGRLDNAGDSVELVAPDAPQTSGPEAGFVPYVMVDKVVYDDAAPWPANADGLGASLQRINFAGYGNEPTNWLAAAPTAGSSGQTDTDGDGMPDSWEDQNGLNKLVNDAGLDADLDGFTNGQEYVAGTNPQSAASRLRLEQVTQGTNGVTLRFTARAHRTYSVLYQDSLQPGAWFKLVDVPPQPTDQAMNVTDSSSLGQSRRFYRLVTPAAP